MVLNEKSKRFVIIESEHATLGKSELKSQLRKAGVVDDDDEEEEEENLEACILPPRRFGHVRGPKGQWASCIRVLDPFTGETSQIIELDDNEAAFSLATTTLTTTTTTSTTTTDGERNGDSAPISEMFVIVGTGRNVTLSPRTQTEAYLRVYKWNQEGTELEFVHKTPTEEIPTALLGFNGQLMIGMGRTLRIYQMSKKRLCRKATKHDQM